MDDFIVRMDFRASLRLFLFLSARDEELEGGAAELYAALRAYLYERLSIEEMESPQALLDSLERSDSGAL